MHSKTEKIKQTKKLKSVYFELVVAKEMVRAHTQCNMV